MEYATEKAKQDELNELVKMTSEALKEFPQGVNGITPDYVKTHPDYIIARAASKKAFENLRSFNAIFVKKFKKEIRANRRHKVAPKRTKKDINLVWNFMWKHTHEHYTGDVAGIRMVPMLNKKTGGTILTPIEDMTDQDFDLALKSAQRKEEKAKSRELLALTYFCSIDGITKAKAKSLADETVRNLTDKQLVILVNEIKNTCAEETKRSSEKTVSRSQDWRHGSVVLSKATCETEEEVVTENTYKFITNRQYVCRSIGDSECIFKFKIVRRTAKTVWIIGESHTEPKACRVKIWNDVEVINPLGKYSMCPVLSANLDETRRILQKVGG